MRAIVFTLARLALRHYRDPLSWAGIITAVGAAAHTNIPPEYVTQIEGILGAIVAMLLLAADGRKNPNTDPATGAIPVRVQDVAPDAPAAAPGTAGAANPLQPIAGPVVRPSDNPGPHRPGFGPY